MGGGGAGGAANLKSVPGGRYPSYATERRGSRRSGHGGRGLSKSGRPHLIQNLNI